MLAWLYDNSNPNTGDALLWQHLMILRWTTICSIKMVLLPARPRMTLLLHLQAFPRFSLLSPCCLRSARALTSRWTDKGKAHAFYMQRYTPDWIEMQWRRRHTHQDYLTIFAWARKKRKKLLGVASSSCSFSLRSCHHWRFFTSTNKRRSKASSYHYISIDTLSVSASSHLHPPRLLHSPRRCHTSHPSVRHTLSPNASLSLPFQKLNPKSIHPLYPVNQVYSQVSTGLVLFLHSYLNLCLSLSQRYANNMPLPLLLLNHRSPSTIV